MEAPAGLKQRVRAAVRQASGVEAAPVRRSREPGWVLLRWLAPAVVVALVLLVALFGVIRPAAESQLASEVVSAHIRSLMANHLTDVASTDQHTVKPWFNGRVTFSPPGTDLSAQGFALVGGRLDVLAERPVAALIYQRRKHFINLFIWPAPDNARTGGAFLVQRGYRLVHWAEGGMEYWAVSDVNRADLEEFARMLRAPMPEPRQ